jgi:hypothetical protein
VELKSKSGTSNINLLVPFAFPKFVRECVVLCHELRKAGTSRERIRLSHGLPRRALGSQA